MMGTKFVLTWLSWCSKGCLNPSRSTEDSLLAFTLQQTIHSSAHQTACQQGQFVCSIQPKNLFVVFSRRI